MVPNSGYFIMIQFKTKKKKEKNPAFFFQSLGKEMLDQRILPKKPQINQKQSCLETSKIPLKPLKTPWNPLSQTPLIYWEWSWCQTPYICVLIHTYIMESLIK